MLGERSVDGAVHALSDQQKALWFRTLFEPDATFNTYLTFRLKGVLDVERFRRAFGSVIAFFSSFRTRFVTRADGEVLQEIAPSADIIRLDYFDLLEEAPGVPDLDARARAMIDEYNQRLFDLRAGAPYRLAIVRFADDGYYLTGVQHHIVSDAQSGLLFAEALGLVYTRGASALAERFPRNADIRVFFEAAPDAESREAACSYWRSKLEGCRMPVDFGRAAEGYTAGEVAFELGESLVATLKAVSKKQRSTPFLTLTAAFAASIRRYFQIDDLALGYAANNRPRAYPELYGYFVSLFPFRLRVDPQRSFAELIEQVTQQRKADSRHEAVSVLDIARFISQGSEASAAVDFNVTVGPTKFKTELVLEGLEAVNLEMCGGRPKYDLSLLFDPTIPGMPCVLRHNARRLPGWLVEQFAAYLVRSLQLWLDAPEKRLAECETLAPEELAMFLEASRGPVRDLPEVSLGELFRERAARDPQHPALVFEDVVLSYGELDARARCAALGLSSAGVTAEDRVIVCLKRSHRSVEALLGVFLAGAVYVPIAPDLPQLRFEQIRQNCKARFILTDREGAARFSELPASITLLVLEDLTHTAATVLSDPAARRAGYVIYTSGSTGAPKGVECDELPLRNTILHQIARAGCRREFWNLPGGAIASSRFAAFASSSTRSRPCSAENPRSRAPP